MSVDQDVLHLFRAGVPLEQIRDRFAHRSITQTEAAIRRAMEANAKSQQRMDLQRLEVERIDALYRAAYPLALQGDMKAIDTCLKLSDKRARLLDDDGPASGLTDAFERSLDDLDLRGADEAVIEAGRATAKQIDEVLEHGTSQDRTKALYLLPHLMNVLKELGATPAARQALSAQARKKGEQSVSKLEALQKGVVVAVAS